jgi:hypothetical protein
MFYVGQRVVCDRMGIHRQWTDPESGRLEIETYYDVENGVARFPQRGSIAPAEGVHGFPQRGGIYTVAGITPGKITLKEIPYIHWEDIRETEPEWWDQNLFRPFNNSGKRDLKWFEVLERVREIERDMREVPNAEIYAVAFKKFMDVRWGGPRKIIGQGGGRRRTFSTLSMWPYAKPSMMITHWSMSSGGANTTAPRLMIILPAAPRLTMVLPAAARMPRRAWCSCGQED